MIKRLLIVIAVTALLIFVPYFIGMEIGKRLDDPNGLIKIKPIVWLLGFGICVMVFGLSEMIRQFFPKLINYIKHGKS